jgi:hypothetical protein
VTRRRILPAGMICAFRVHPEDGRQYYSVHVWESRKALRQYLATSDTGQDIRQVIACCLWPRRRRPVHIGEIHLNQQDLDQGTISHEATHAVLEWARRQSLDVHNPSDPAAANDDEERFCEAIGRLVYSIDAQLQENRLCKK